MPMAQVSRQYEDAIDGAFAAGEPALQDHGGHGVAQIMKARRAAVERYAFSQPTERPINSAGSQPVSSHRNEEILGERKLPLSAASVSS